MVVKWVSICRTLPVNVFIRAEHFSDLFGLLTQMLTNARSTMADALSFVSTRKAHTNARAQLALKSTGTESAA